MARQLERQEDDALQSVRQLADQAFARAAGAPLVEGNDLRLLKDAKENYPAWLDAIRSAKRSIHFENYIIYNDRTGNEFADALIAKAREGVRVRLIYDWMGVICNNPFSRSFWNRVREGGESWSTSALACALGSSQRTVQRELRQLEEAAAVRAVGRGRSRRWLAPALGGFATNLLLPGALPIE